MGFRSQIASCLAIALLVVPLLQPEPQVLGQDPPPVTNPARNGDTAEIPGAGNASEPPLKPAAGDYLFVLDENGKIQPVLVNPDVMEFLNRSGEDPPKNAEPRVSFSDVTLEGRTIDDDVHVTVRLTLQVAEEERWIRVPLGLNEGVLRKSKHEYRPVAPAAEKRRRAVQARFAGFDPRGGYDWWFRGAGEHVLTLEMIVLVRKSSGFRRFQLALPESASSYLKLDVPIQHQQLALEASTAGPRKTKASGSGRSQIEVFRLGRRLDLSWRELPNPAKIETLLIAESELRVEPTEESVLLKTRQLIEPLQGSMSELKITLPPGFAILELKRDGERVTDYIEPDQAGEPVTIPLPSATTDQVRLDWLLQSTPEVNGEVVIRGFDVSGALTQRGEIGIVDLDGYRIVKRSSSDINRTNVRELSEPVPVFSAYEFRQQPFQLTLGLEKIEPSYSVSPHVFLKMHEKQMDLLLDVELEVFRGVVETLDIEWRDFTEQEWKIETGELTGIVDHLEYDEVSPIIKVHFAKRLSQGENLRLRAKRSLSNKDVEEDIPLTLPRVLAPSPVRTVVSVAHQQAVDSNLTPQKSTGTLPLSAGLSEQVEAILKTPRMHDFRGARQSGFLIRSSAHAFRVRLVTHPQTISSQSELQVAMTDGGFDVKQELELDVKYARLTELPLKTPPAFPKRTVFLFEGEPLPVQWSEAGNSRQALLTFPRPVIGAVRLSTQFSIDAEGSEAAIPLANVANAESSPMHLELASDDASSIQVVDPAWVKSPLGESWESTRSASTVRLAWSPKQRGELQDFIIKQARLRSVIQTQGAVYSLGEYRFDSHPRRILISFPEEELIADSFYWNGQKLEERHIAKARTGPGDVWLDLPDADADGDEEQGDSILAVQFHSTAETASLGTELLDLAAPVFPGEVWVESTVWDVVLPAEQHLFDVPRNYAPEYSWTRDGLLWKRVVSQTNEEAKVWLKDLRADYLRPEGNRYRFSYVGPSPPLRFSMMNRSIVVLIGAGLALAIGIVLLKFPRSRNSLSFLGVLFAVALAGVWYPAPLQLLIQPAVLGLMLAIVAVLLDGTFRKTPSHAGLPMDDQREMSGSSGRYVPAMYPEPIGSEDPTAVRQNEAQHSGSSKTRDFAPQPEKDPPPSHETVGSSISENVE